MSIYVARQPIFDTADHVTGYELLYRRNADLVRAEGVDGNTMSSLVIANAFLGMGIREITGDAPGFINFTRDQLLDRTYELLDPTEVVVELLENIECSAETLTACRAMHAAGYVIALDDFVYSDSYIPMLELASIVKIDVLDRDDADLKTLIGQVTPYNVTLLAERVETADVHARCKAMGFELFQGYFYVRPETMVGEDLDSGQLAILRLLNMLRDPDLTDAELDKSFRGNPALCYKLLQIVNSAAIGGRGVESIQHAVRLIGHTALRRWLALVLAASFAANGGTQTELAVIALTRARMCELMAERSSNALASNPLFMTGLLSMMGALMRVPMDKVLARVEVAPDVRNALLTRTGILAPALMLAEAYESGDWDFVRDLASHVEVDAATVPNIYIDALAWAQQQIQANAG
jgi:EAL and modified HD-GYP domain-containing signal transduction protein